jgi:putative hydrolase of the HAD superfamily
VSLEAVIFDWGGTLSIWVDIDIEDMWRLAARHVAPEREQELMAELISVEARSWDRVHTDQRSTRLVDLLSEASRVVGVDVAAALLEEAAGHHLDAWTPHIRHDPEAGNVLRELRDRGLRIGLLSNTHWPRQFHERFLERDGLAGLIDARFYTSEMEFVKPHPSGFKAVLDALEVADPRAAVFVGDRLHDDIRGAQNAGLRAVWIRNANVGVPPVAGNAVEPDAVIESLSDLPDLLARRQF